MPVHPNSLENLKKGIPFSDNTHEKQRKIAAMGGKKSGESKREKKNLIELFQIAQEAKVPNEKVAEQLRNAGLPDTFAGQMAYNVIQKAGTNPMMLRTLLEALGLLDTKNNVIVNNNPQNQFAGLTEDELRALAQKRQNG